MARDGKRIRQARDGIDRTRLYRLDEALELVKDRAKAKFDETVEVAMNLGVDPRHADQMVRGVAQLPNGTGRQVRVAVFARGDKADEGRAVEFRVEKAGIVHAGVGKASFTAEALTENIRAFADAVQRAKPTGAKGTYVQRVAVTSTMGPGVRVDPASLAQQG